MPEYQADHSGHIFLFSYFYLPVESFVLSPPFPYSSHKHATRPITSVCIERGQHFCSFHFITILFTLILYWISKLHDLFLLFFAFRVRHQFFYTLHNLKQSRNAFKYRVQSKNNRSVQRCLMQFRDGTRVTSRVSFIFYFFLHFFFHRFYLGIFCSLRVPLG